MISTLQANRTHVRAGFGLDFTPVPETAGLEMSRAEALLEAPFRPSPEERLSFLVNGLCLIGGHRVLEWDAGSLPSHSSAAALEALGHAVTQGGPGLATPRADGFDRAYRVRRAFGHGGDEAGRLWLKAMHQALQPGGLLLFHAFDRDRVYGLVERLSAPAAGEGVPAAEAGTGAYAFDPKSGMLTVRVRTPDVSKGLRAAVRAYHIGELQALLEESGFTLERAYGDWQGGAPETAGARTGRMLVVAARDRRIGAGTGKERGVT